MRIAVDGRHMAAGRGVGRYARELLDALTREFPGDDWVVLPRRGRAAYAAGALTGRPRIERVAGGADVLWVPAPAPLGASRTTPLVLTVHDLSWLRRPTDFTAYERLWHRAARVRALAERAARVIAVSEATRDELVGRWPALATRVVVVRSGPGLVRDAGRAAQLGGQVPHVVGASPEERAAPPYLLAVGALEPRKQPDLLARAHAHARARGLDAELWFAGSGRLAGALAGDRVRVLGEQGDTALRALYAGALALVHPAAVEGFGFPPVEALAHGTPAVVADLPVHRETVGDGALRFAPGDERALADALLRVERDGALRARLVHAGRAAIERLSWRRAARETHAVLAEAAAR